MRFIDKTSLTDLLTDGGRVAGAVGFDLLDGTPIVVKAPAAIIATGGQSYRIMGMWSCQRGDGLGMAWRAGAQMRNAEWGPFAQLAGIRGKEPLIGAEDALYNAWHEKLSPTFRGEYEADVCGMTSAVWYQQMKAGNGPLVTFHPENWMLANTTEDVEGGTVWDRPDAVKFWQTLISRVRSADAPGAFLEVFPAVLGELSPIKRRPQHGDDGTGPLRLRQRLLQRLRSARRRAGLARAHARGGPLRRHLHGHPRRRGGGVRRAPAAEPDVAQAEALVRDALAPLERGAGVPAMELVRGIQNAVNPAGYSIYKSEERMTEALGMVLDVKERLPQVTAQDPHYLVAAHDARNMTLSAELFYRTALTRRESRGWFIREDYPERDDAGWLKWVHAADDGGEMRIWTEDVPVAGTRTSRLRGAEAREPQRIPRTRGEAPHTRGAGQALRQVLHHGPRPARTWRRSSAWRRDRGLDQSQMLMPEDINRLLDPGNFEVETGWGMMDNGAGYIAMRHEMPGVTIEMIDWWFAWHPIEPLRYRIWFPPYHLGVGVDDWARARLLDPDVPAREKCSHVIHHVSEDTGMGTEHIEIHFLTPEEMGFDMSRWHAPNVGTFVGGFGFSPFEHQPPGMPAAPAIMCHFVREMDGGVEWRTRFWMGYTIMNGRPVCLLPPGVRVPERRRSASPTTTSTSTHGSSRFCRSLRGVRRHLGLTRSRPSGLRQDVGTRCSDAGPGSQRLSERRGGPASPRRCSPCSASWRR